MVFAHLVHSQLDPLLEFLCSLPGPTGKPALEFVMTEWMSRQHLFYGQYEGKVRSDGLIIYFYFRIQICSFPTVLNPYRAPCPTARWPSVSCSSTASTRMTNVSKTLLWREKRYTALKTASAHVLNLSRVSHHNASSWIFICSLLITPQDFTSRDGPQGLANVDLLIASQTLKDGPTFLC